MTSIGIIGAGPSGLVSAKSALECSLEPMVFEKSETIGGLWRPETGSTWNSMRTNISYHSCMFSDFGWGEDVEDFPNQRQVYEYLCRYTKEFKLDPYLRLGSEVTSIKKLDKKWKVEWIKNGERSSKVFDFLIVSSGFFSTAHTPQIPGLETFTGTVIHASLYKTPEPFRDKKVVVVGNAFSGCEIASEVASVAKRVVNSTHRAIWILPRTLAAFSGKERKLPGDLLFYDRASKARNLEVSQDAQNERKHSWFRDVTGQEKIGAELAVDAKPKDPQFVAISDIYLKKIEEKKITVIKSGLREIQADKVFFEDGSTENADALIFSTGYRTKLPFFDKTALDDLEFLPEESPMQPLLLHKTVFHPSLPNAAFVGMYRGPFFGVMELQARWACMVFSKKVAVPTLEQMQEGIDVERKIREMVPSPQFPHGDYVGLADDLASQIHALPDFEKLKEENVELYNKLWNRPLVPPHYRLTGFASKPEFALQIIEKVQEVYESGV